jgi:hypothetical protein
MIKKFAYILLGCIVLLLLLSPLFIKVNIECRSQFGPCPDEINSKLYKLSGKNLFQAKTLASKYLKTDIQVEDYSLQFKIPDALLISLIINKPEFAIRDKSKGHLGLVDKEGKIISLSSSSSLPTVEVLSKDITIGAKVERREFFALELMRGIWQMYQVVTGEVQDESLVVELPGSIRVILPLDGDLQVLLGELRLVYGKIASPDLAGKYSQIDLRFKNPVLR